MPHRGHKGSTPPIGKPNDLPVAKSRAVAHAGVIEIRHDEVPPVAAIFTSIRRKITRRWWVFIPKGHEVCNTATINARNGGRNRAIERIV